MSDHSGARMRPADIAEAVALLTRFPVPAHQARGAVSAWAWPLAGLPVAVAAGVAGWLAHAFGLPASIAAGLALAVSVLATGAFHEDGLADCADGFWGGTDAETRLAIMKDSRIGTFGALALAFSVFLRWQAMAILLAGGWFFAPLLAAAILSRAPMAALMTFLPPARSGGLAAGLGQPHAETAALAGLTAVIPALLLTGFAAIPAALGVAIVSFGVAALARDRIGGHTGDVLGGAQQVAEIAALAAFAAVIG